MVRILAFLVFLLLPATAFAQGQQCRTSPVGASTAYCGSEAFVTESIAAAVAALPDGTVTEQKNTAGAGLSISGNCDNTSTNASSPCQYTATGAPYFRVHASSSQSLVGAAAIVNLDTVDFQVGGAFNTTSHRFNPAVAGTYKICVAGRITGSFAATNGIDLLIGKNGNANPQADFLSIASGTVSSLSGAICQLVQLNGSTDTVEFDADGTAGASPVTDNTPYRTFMTGELVGP